MIKKYSLNIFLFNLNRIYGNVFVILNKNEHQNETIVIHKASFIPS